MIFPDYIKAGDFFGVTAPSDGNRKEMDFKRLDLAKRNLEEKRFHTIVTPNVYTSERGKSSSKKERAEQLMSLFLNTKVKVIILAKGGDFLMEILPLLDFDIIKKNPKWIQGFSDSTSLLFLITTICDMATIYGNHFNDYAITPWHKSQEYNLKLLLGEQVVQESFKYYEDGFYDKENAWDSYREVKPVRWNRIKSSVTSMKGRMIGGCMDVLLNLVGTRFDYISNYILQYKGDGILWYLESFSLDTESITRGLWQMKEAGWFEHASGFVFGRPCMYESFLGYSYEESVLSVLEEFQKPILFDVDIGHKSPQFSVINGAIGEFSYQDGKGTFKIV